jgi:UvrD/REP helicase N-terminal domain
VSIEKEISSRSEQTTLPILKAIAPGAIVRGDLAEPKVAVQIRALSAAIPASCKFILNRAMSNRQQKSSAFRRLNLRQQKAVCHGIKDGVATEHRPLLIIAGAGIGKTETMGMRTGNLVACGAKQGEIFVVSFTRNLQKSWFDEPKRRSRSSLANRRSSCRTRERFIPSPTA